MAKTMFAKFMIIIVSLVVCFTILEAGLRLLGRLPTNMTDGIFEQFGNSYKLKKNIVKITNWPSFSFTTYTNDYGFRAKDTGTVNLDNYQFQVFLGASDVFANGVNYEDSFVGIYEQTALLHNNKVLNMAAGGYWFFDQEKILKDFIRIHHYKPSIVFFGMNPLTMTIFDKKHENILVKSGYLFDKRSWILPYLRTMVGNLSSAFCFFRDAIRILQNNWQDPGKKGKIPAQIHVYSKESRLFDSTSARLFEEHLTLFEKYCQDNQITLIYIYLPLADSFDIQKILKQLGKDPNDYNPDFYEKLIERHCLNNNIKLIDLKPLLLEQHQKGIQIRFDMDPHYNIYANRIIGEYLISEIWK